MALHESNQMPLLIVHLFFARMEVAADQNCGCFANHYCSRFGYCRTHNDYCDTECQQGPCYSSPNNGGSVVGIMTQSFFDDIINQTSSGCTDRRFYTRDAFLTAAGYYPNFGCTDSADDSRRKIAAFFAHVTHETGHFCYVKEINGSSRDYCDENNTEWSCVAGRSYYVSNPLQLSWNYNYDPVGRAIGFDGLRAPETVANDVVISFRTGLWFWMNNCHNNITSSQGFDATIHAINDTLECNGRNQDTVNARVRYYMEYYHQLGVDPSTNLTC